MELPDKFVEMIHELLGSEANNFLSAMRKSPEVSVRVNSRKPSECFRDEERVPWCETGHYLPERPVFTLDPFLHAGAYYVQDASSMIYGEVVSRLLKIFENEGLPPGTWPLSLLDMCAAPGGKTTAMIDRLPDNSIVTANEYVTKRFAILRENLTKWGFPVHVTNKSSNWFVERGMLFDIVAVDAPCSGEGMMRKDEGAVAQWSQKLVDDCSGLQKDILRNASLLVRPGGFLIYSTCTYNRKENEENLQFAVDQLGMEPLELDFPIEWGIPRAIGTDLPAWRFMPHKTKGEGLFLCVLRKPGVFIQSNRPIVPFLNKNLVDRCEGKVSGRKKEKNMKKGGNITATNVPGMDEILMAGFDGHGFPMVELTKEQALAYLRRESIILPEGTPSGIVIFTYGGLPLGPAKNIGTRANNLYPKEWRILMR